MENYERLDRGTDGTLDIRMVRFEEIFLSYIETANGKTIYEKLEEKHFLLN